MADFASVISNAQAARRVPRAIDGCGAFRHFRNELYEEYSDLLPGGQAFREARALYRAVAWLADQGLVDSATAARFIVEHPVPDLP
jgi:hypothetical protein